MEKNGFTSWTCNMASLHSISIEVLFHPGIKIGHSPIPQSVRRPKRTLTDPSSMLPEHKKKIIAKDYHYCADNIFIISSNFIHTDIFFRSLAEILYVTETFCNSCAINFLLRTDPKFEIGYIFD